MSDVKTNVSYAHDKLIIERVQDCEPYTEQVRRERETVSKGDIRKAGIIPFMILEAWIRANGMTFSEFMRDRNACKRLLNDPDLSKFRVWKGRV